MKTHNAISDSRLRSTAGAALIVAVILGAAIALALGTFLYIANSELKMAGRTGTMTMVNNVAEAGLEELLSVLNTPSGNPVVDPSRDPLTDSYNKLNTGVWTSSDYDGISTSNGDRRKIFSNYVSTSQKVSSSVSVILMSTSTPRQYYAAAKAVSTGANMAPVEKYAWAAIRRKPLVPPGMFARFLIELKGTSVAIDSYRSSLGIYGATLASPPPGSYNGKNIFSYAMVASVSSTVNVGQADIYGNVATGGSDPADTVGNTGIIGEWGDSNGTIDTTQTATNFTAEFDLVYPTKMVTGIPKYPSDLIDPLTGNPIYQLGDPSTTNSTPWVYYLKASEIDGSQLYTVVGPTRIVIVPETSGSYNGRDGKIAVTSGGFKVNYLSQLFDINANGVAVLKDANVPSLQIFTRGDIAMSGQGIVNDPVSGSGGGTNQGIPLAVQIYGYAADNGSTTTAPQSFDFTGNQAIAATIYAPNANVKLGGGGSDEIDMMGSLVAKNITLNGKVVYHVDEDLANAENGKFGVAMFRELLTPNQRTGAEMSRAYAFGL